MNETKPIVKGSIVKYNGGHYRVTAKTKETVNLGQIFGSHIYYKRIPLTEVMEDEDVWHEAWTKSESYQSM